MLRLVKYILLFFLGFIIIRMLFGKKSVGNNPGGKVDDKRENPDAKRYDKDDGDYIDYEEIK